jgi:hypothetical protein
MDNIDITDSAFSLEVPDLNNIISSGESIITDYTMFIYIGAAILLAIICIFIYNFYQNKRNNQDENCSGGFCTMGNNPNI